MIRLLLLLPHSHRRRSVFVTYDLQDMHAKVHENEWFIIFSDHIIILLGQKQNHLTQNEVIKSNIILAINHYAIHFITFLMNAAILITSNENKSSLIIEYLFELLYAIQTIHNKYSILDCHGSFIFQFRYMNVMIFYAFMM